jgi:hypothetical protein
MIISLAGHEINSVEKVYYDIASDELQSDGSLAVTGSNPSVINSSAERNAAKTIQYWIQTGSTTQSAITELVNESSNWTTNHRGRGIAYIYSKLKYDRDLFINGMPKTSCLVQGALVYDPRTSATSYSNNPALCLRDYLTNSKYGLGVPTAEIDDTSFTTAANLENIKKILTSMAGYLVYSNGKFKCYAGEYRTPTVTLTEDDLVDSMQIIPKLSKRDSFNSVRGVYISEDNDWQGTDFTPLSNSTYVSEDNSEVIWNNLVLDMVKSEATAQRLAKISLERVRQQITVNAKFKMSAFELDVGDTVSITNTRMGWSSKVFEVQAWAFVWDKSTQELVVQTTLRETASAVWDWNEATEETEVDAAPNTNLPNGFSVSALTGLTLESGTDQLITQSDGTIKARLKVSWDDPDDAFVTEDGEIQIQYKKDTETAWRTWNAVRGNENSAFITDVEESIAYSVRIRAVNSLRRYSAYTTETGHTVVGKTEPPTNVSTFYAYQVDDAIGFDWNEITDLDLAGYEIRYGIQDQAVWMSAIPLSKTTKGTHNTLVNLPPGNWTVLIKSIDTSGNYSNRAAAYNIDVGNNNSILEYQENEDFAKGTLSNFILHYTGVLYPDSITLASDSSVDVFDHSACTYQECCTYTSPEIDLGTSTAVRVWSDISGGLLPNISSGFFRPDFKIFYRTASDPSGVYEADNDQLVTPSTATLTNCVLHYTGVIVPDSQDLGSVSGFDTFNNYVPNPYDDWEYELSEIDLGADRNVTVKFEVTTENGPGETGATDATLELDYKAAAGSYDGFEEITGPKAINARYIKLKVKGNTQSGVQKVTEFNTTIDPFIDWQLGTFTGQYLTFRIKMDTSTQGKGKVTNIQVTADR